MQQGKHWETDPITTGKEQTRLIRRLIMPSEVLPKTGLTRVKLFGMITGRVIGTWPLDVAMPAVNW